MIVFLINGLSYSGKTTIVEECCRNEPTFNIIKSWTTRKTRHKNDNDHCFTTKEKLAKKMLTNPYVASTMIDDNIYCAFESQFKKDCVNFYIVDDLGLLDVYNHTWADTDVTYISIRIKRDLSEFKEKKRVNRFSSYLDDSVFDYVILNNVLKDSIKVFQEIVFNEVNKRLLY